MLGIISLDENTLDQAYRKSFYTIAGVGGDLSDWLTGYGNALEEAGIERPRQWYSTTGANVNAYAESISEVFDPFPDNVTILMFEPIQDVGKLALFKLQWGDRWFDDIVENMTL